MNTASFKSMLGTAVLGCAFLTPAHAATASPKPGAAAAAPCAPLLQHNFLRLQDEKPQTLCQYSGKVLLVVNTASFCGFTAQYKGLEALHAKYRDKGLVVLGFPSNDFSQETGSNKEIADFCENTFGVKFPMFTKSSVSGKTANPLFKQLAEWTGSAPRWNFHKYLISRDGQEVSSFATSVDPGNSAFLRDIEKKLLAK
ncbi:glutathione peroxidase [Polaromonas sp.]|uniref:glutathione peroxidase n=1 Tax=Polaromonas sp. TaxID=1869339 RepID=UPI0037516790